MGERRGAVENMVKPFWQGRKIFVTGHTGFKGSWLALWLQQLQADLMGYALPPHTVPSLFAAAQVDAGMQSILGDLNDLPRMQAAMQAHRPEIVIHMAAQALVRASYQDPIGTYETNVLGTAKLLQAVRACDSVRAVVVVTTDKCYENREWLWAYRENDALGGHDPYSNSKASAELVVSAYRDSFFPPDRYAEHQVALATARAGNVIGGGDWSQDRLVADIIRAFGSGETLQIRNPLAVRPWQHVLEPLRGYLALAQRLLEDGPRYAGAWNFGPECTDARPVEWIVKHLAQAWGQGARWEIDRGAHPHEAQTLKLDWTKAHQQLGWRPALRLSDALDYTLTWYKEVLEGADAREKCQTQIAEYEKKVQTLAKDV